ncbi:MFS transporter [Actinomadura nitritigenes]|uniref:MFS transporter n=1 Tax=Actinomadura nitritigenes TaxID=134602 RepID=UPI003D8FBFA6
MILTYVPSYLKTTLDYSATTAYFAAGTAILFDILVIPFAAVLSDRVGRRPGMLAAAIGFVVGAVPLFMMIQDGGAGASVALGLLGGCTGCTSASAARPWRRSSRPATATAACPWATTSAPRSSVGPCRSWRPSCSTGPTTSSCRRSSSWSAAYSRPPRSPRWRTGPVAHSGVSYPWFPRRGRHRGPRPPRSGWRPTRRRFLRHPRKCSGRNPW